MLQRLSGVEQVLTAVNSVVEDDLDPQVGGVALHQRREQVVPTEDGNNEDDNMDPENADLEDLDAIQGEEVQAAQEQNQRGQAAAEQVGAAPPRPRFHGDPAYSPEFLASLKINGMPHGKLHLKKGAPVMLLRPLDPSNGLCNGTRLIIRTIRRRVLEAVIISGTHQGKVVLIPRITLYSRKEDIGFILSRRQFPVRLAFAMTINKSQGQSVAHVGVDLRVPAFAHGQLYVAMSRVTSASGIKVLFPEDSEDSQTANVVYKEILLHN